MVSLLVETIHTKTRFAFFISTVLQGNNHLFALMLLPCRTFVFCYHTTLLEALLTMKHKNAFHKYKRF